MYLALKCHANSLPARNQSDRRHPTQTCGNTSIRVGCPTRCKRSWHRQPRSNPAARTASATAPGSPLASPRLVQRPDAVRQLQLGDVLVDVAQLDAPQLAVVDWARALRPRRFLPFYLLSRAKTLTVAKEAPGVYRGFKWIEGGKTPRGTDPPDSPTIA